MPCSVLSIVHELITVYVVIMLIYAVVSWIPSIRGRWSDYVAMLVEPVLLPVRRIIPPLGGLDLSFLVVIILLQVIDSSLRGMACTY
jgi:YggT family protein